MVVVSIPCLDTRSLFPTIGIALPQNEISIVNIVSYHQFASRKELLNKAMEGCKERLWWSLQHFPTKNKQQSTYNNNHTLYLPQARVVTLDIRVVLIDRWPWLSWSSSSSSVCSGRKIVRGHDCSWLG